MADSAPATNISAVIYLSARYKSYSFEGRWAFTQEDAAAVRTNVGAVDGNKSWPIQLGCLEQPPEIVGCDIPPTGAYRGFFANPDGQEVKDSVNIEFAPRRDTVDLIVTGEGRNNFGHFRLNGTYCIATRVMTCTKTYGPSKRRRPVTNIPHHGFTNKHNSFSSKLFKPIVQDFIAQLIMSQEHHLASHMERYQPLDQQQQQRVFSLFVNNPIAQKEVAKSGKPGEKLFRGFLARYDMKLQTSLIPNEHFRKLFKTLRTIKRNCLGNNRQHRLTIELKKAARDCGIASLSSYVLEYKDRQQEYNARRDAASTSHVVKLLGEADGTRPAKPTNAPTAAHHATWAKKMPNVPTATHHASMPKAASAFAKQRPYSFNIKLFKQILKDFIAQLKMLKEHRLASHMERYQPLDQQQQPRVWSMFVNNPIAQQEVKNSGKPGEEAFRCFLARYDMKLQSSLIPDSHFRNLFQTLRELKANYAGSNLQHRVANELNKAAHECGITSLASYRLEFEDRQQRYSAHRDAGSTGHVVNPSGELDGTRPAKPTDVPTAAHHATWAKVNAPTVTHHVTWAKPTDAPTAAHHVTWAKVDAAHNGSIQTAATKQRTYSFNIKLFKQILQDFITQLKLSKMPQEHHLASHMERYQPLDQQQQQRVWSIFFNHPIAQKEVAKSGKPGEEVFRGFLARYDMKLQTSQIPYSHFRSMFKTMREVKANYKGNNLQHRVVKKLSKAARDCGITSLGSYRLEYKERQKQYNARRDAASAVQSRTAEKVAHPPVAKQEESRTAEKAVDPAVAKPGEIVDHSWKQHVNRAKYIEKIWVMLKKHQPKRNGLVAQAENIEHKIIGSAKTEAEYIQAMDKYKEKFMAKAEHTDTNKRNIEKQVKKLLQYYDTHQHSWLKSWEKDVNELRKLVESVKVDVHVSKSYKRMRELFLKCQKCYVAYKKKNTVPTPFDIGPECKGMCAKVGETPGTIRYVGETLFGEGTWIGMELDTPTGNSNGTVPGKDGQPTKYFSCRPHHGMFVHTGKEKLVLPSIRATDARRFVTLLLCFQRRSNATATAKGQWTPRFARNVHSLMHAFAMSDVCVLRVTEYVASRHPRGEQPAMVRQHFFKTFCNMKFEYVYTACKALDRSKRYSMTRFFQWTGANSPPNTFPIGHTNLKHLRTTPSNLSSKTIKGIFGWQGDLLMLSFSSPARVRRKKPNIGQFVTGDIQPVHHPRNFLATMGATPGASFAFVADVIGPAERAAIRNVVDAAYLRYVDRVANQSTPGVAREVETDFKLKLSPEELRRLLGRATLDRVHALVNATACRHSDGNNRDATNKTGINIQFNTGSNLGSNASNTTRHSSSAMNCEHQSNHAIPDYNNILVRRCAARGRCIPWHVDVTNWVCQVTLNDDYEGGDLTYLLEDGVRCPRRPAGSATVHGGALGRVMHAVTQLRGGVRYGLFLFKTDQM